MLFFKTNSHLQYIQGVEDCFIYRLTTGVYDCDFNFVAGNLALLDLTPLQLHNRFVCRHHFLEKDFTKTSRRRLMKFAVPLPAKNVMNKQMKVILLQVSFR